MRIVPIIVLALMTPAALAEWSSPFNVSQHGNAYGKPAICVYQQRVLVAWSDPSSGQARIYCREYNGSSWGSVQRVATNGANEADYEPDIAFDSAGNAHCVWYRRNTSTNQYYIYYSQRAGTAWSAPLWLSQNSASHVESPSIAVDRLDHLHVAFNDFDAGNPFGIRYRFYDGSAWSPALTSRAERITGSGNAYVPHVVADSSNNPHVVWSEYTDNYDVYYSKKVGGSWLSSPVNLSQVSADHTSDPDVAIDRLDRLHVVWTDFYTGNPQGTFYRLWDGAKWVPALNLIADNISDGPSNTYGPAVAVDANESPHVVWEKAVSGSGYDIWYNSKGPSGWRQPANITPSSGYHTEVPACSFDSDGVFQVAFMDDPTATGTYDIFHIRNVQPAPPDPVTQLWANGGSRRAELSWVNPASPQFSGTMIRMRADAFPTSPTDGTLIVDKPNTPGSADSLTLTGLAAGTCYFSAFAHDVTPIYAPASTASAYVGVSGDFDADGDVDMQDFGHLQICLTGAGHPQDDPACLDARLDPDTDVDEDDFGVFERCLTGAGVSADLACDQSP